ncbi:aspartic peptidase domain-containing protein [Gymnopilus junonius]|uniref:Aspartic peptidase domain-containing protein n=1 Tax=Gymnopilus junonius TaxID=109634 RepID=A0A9P5NZL0_GYMJU|nr:aspartic peptidase domain-containing protein [Gymnopilus junonius]
MRLPLGVLERLVGSFYGFSWFIALLFLRIVPLEVSAQGLSGRLVPRGSSDPINLPIRSLQARSLADNTTFGAGLADVSLTSDRQSYFTVIQAGNLNFRVNLDTASADLWLVSNNCSTNTCKAVPRYPLDHQSPTFGAVNNNATAFQAHYADGTFASGFVATETLQLANLTLANQELGVVTSSNVSLTDQSSGIMGLGFPRLSSIPSNATNSSSFFATLASRGLLEYPIFALSLTRNDTGTLSLGAIDSSVVSNASLIGWNKVAEFSPFGAESNVSSYLQWAIQLSAIAVNGTQLLPIPTYPSSGQTRSLALFDVGSPGVYGPFQDVSRIFAQVDGARLVDENGIWAIPCDTTTPLSFTFGLRNYTLLPTDYIIGEAAGDPNLCLSWPMALPPSSDGIDWQIGTAFLRTVYSIFSFGIDGKEPPLIGLYPLFHQNSTNVTAITQTPDIISSFLSANSEIIPTTLPNFVLSTPTFTTPPYALNTSVPASVGAIVSTGLANSTYSALFGQKTTLANVSVLPVITPQPSAVTVVVTNSAGSVSTTVSVRTMAPLVLGLPSAGLSHRAPSYLSALVMAAVPFIMFT